MASIKARDGVATIDTLGMGRQYLGSTSGNDFLPIGKEYSSFTFEPKQGESGVLVFRNKGTTAHRFLSFYQFGWDGQKLLVQDGLKNTAHAFSESDELGLVVRIRDWFYVTEYPNDEYYWRVKHHNYKVVDLFVMLKYLTGAIGLKELDRNARAYERRLGFVERFDALKQRADENAQEVERLSAKADFYGRELKEAEAKINQYHGVCSSFGWTRMVRGLPRWMRTAEMQKSLDLIDNLAASGLVRKQ